MKESRKLIIQFFSNSHLFYIPMNKNLNHAFWHAMDKHDKMQL